MKTREAKVNALLAVADLLPYGQCTEQDAARAGLDAVIFEVAHPTQAKLEAACKAGRAEYDAQHRATQKVTHEPCLAVCKRVSELLQTGISGGQTLFSLSQLAGIEGELCKAIRESEGKYL